MSVFCSEKYRNRVKVLAVDEALRKLEADDPETAEIVKLRYFAGLTVPETASVLGVSESTVKRAWRYARLWLFREISDENTRPE